MLGCSAFLISILLFLSMGFSSSAQAATCDVDADGDVDRLDLNLIISARNTQASGPDDPRDADGDELSDVTNVSLSVSYYASASAILNYIAIGAEATP